MKRSHLALGFLVLLSPVASFTANAQTASPTPSPTPAKTKVTVKKKATVNSHGKSAPAVANTSPPLANTAPVAAAPVVPPNPFKLVFYAEYQGPRLSNIDFGKTEDDTGAVSGAAIASFTQFGYAVSKNVVLGARIRYTYSVDPDNTNSAFQWANQRIYAAWANMIDTKDINMAGKIDFELPTTDAARAKGMLLALNLQTNWTLKTALRNWTFSTLVIVRPMFYDSVSSANDVHVELDPDILLDLSADWQLQVEGYFSAAHSAQTEYFDYTNVGDSDTIDIGPLWNINAHYSLYPALRFYTANFNFAAANFYVNFTAAL